MPSRSTTSTRPGMPGAAELEVVRADAEHDRPAGAGAQRRALGQRDRAGAEARLAVLDRRLDQVHGRRADERGHEQVRRVVEQLLGRVALLQHAAAHDRDALAERHRLDLVVGDVDRRHAEPLVQARELRPHRDAQLGVEVAQAARPSGTPPARARSRGPWRRAGAGRRTARPACAPSSRRARGSARPRRRGARSRASPSCAASGRSRGSRARSGAGRARSSGTPSRCRACADPAA